MDDTALLYPPPRQLLWATIQVHRAAQLGPLEDHRAIIVCIAGHKPTSGHIETAVMEDRHTLSLVQYRASCIVNAHVSIGIFTRTTGRHGMVNTA
jgi:hypothetical protein